MKSKNKNEKGKAKPVSFTLGATINSFTLDGSQVLAALCMGYNLNQSADPNTHYLKSLIETKWGFCEQVVADVLKVYKWKDPNARADLGKDFPELRDILQERARNQDGKDFLSFLADKFRILQNKRNTLVHGEMIFEGNTTEFHVPDASKSYRTPWTPIFTPKIVMRRKGITIPLEQNEMLSINREFDEFIDLLRELYIMLLPRRTETLKSQLRAEKPPSNPKSGQEPP